MPAASATAEAYDATVDVVLRPAEPDEAEAAVAVQRAASLAALAHIFPPDRYPFPDEAVLDRWRTALADPARRVVLAERAGTPVGVLLTAPDWLEGLYVVPEEWGSGVAVLLHDEAVRAARERGVEHLHLWVLEDNHRARRFYERRGWKPNERRRRVPYPPHPDDVGYTLELGVCPGGGRDG
jgi:diamine N-acetyltransferase